MISGILSLPAGLNPPRFLDACQNAGLTLQTAVLEAPEAREHGLVIGYSSLALDTIGRAGARLGQLLRAG